MIHLDDAVFIMNNAADLGQLGAVHHDAIRFEISAENGMRDRAHNLAVKRAVSLHLIGEFVLEPFHIKIAHLGIKVKNPLRRNGSVQHHIDHRREDMEHLQTNDAVLHEIVAVHP